MVCLFFYSTLLFIAVGDKILDYKDPWADLAWLLLGSLIIELMNEEQEQTIHREDIISFLKAFKGRWHKSMQFWGRESREND